MFVGAGFYPMLTDNLVGSLVTELVSELSFLDSMHVIESHKIDAKVKWISRILIDLRKAY
jgi:hypothetical protein